AELAKVANGVPLVGLGKPDVQPDAAALVGAFENLEGDLVRTRAGAGVGPPAVDGVREVAVPGDRPALRGERDVAPVRAVDPVGVAAADNLGEGSSFLCHGDGPPGTSPSRGRRARGSKCRGTTHLLSRRCRNQV